MTQIDNRIIMDFEARFKNNAFKNVTDQIQQTINKNKELATTSNISSEAMRKAAQQIDLKKNLSTARWLMKQSGLEANQLSQSLKRMGITIRGGKMFDAFGRSIKKTNINMKELKKNAVRFNMSLLSVMFAGMALQRASSRAFRSLVTTYQKANEETEGLGQATWHLQAAWEFFKYSLIDALTQSPLFQLIVQYLVKFVQWLNKLDQSVKSMIAIGIGVLFVIGTLMLLYGQIGMATIGLRALGIEGGASIIGILGKLILWLVLGYLIYEMINGLFTGWNKGATKAEKSGFSLINVFMFIIKTVRFLGRLVNLGAQVISMSLHNMVDGFRVMGLQLYVNFMDPISRIMQNFQNFINLMIDGINLAIRGMNKLGARISEVPRWESNFSIDTSAAQNKISEIRREMDNRVFSMIMDTPTISQMWAESDMRSLLPQTPSGTTQNNVDMSGLTLNITGATDAIMADIDQLSGEITDKIMENLNDKYSNNIGSNNG